MHLIFLICLLILTGCNSKDPSKTTGFAGIAMTIPYRILIGTRLSYTEKQKVKYLIEETFDETDRIYNYWNPGSEISKLNQLKAHIKTPISPDLQKFLETTAKIVSLTGGRFDPTISLFKNFGRINWIRESCQQKARSLTQKKLRAGIRFTLTIGLFWKDHDEASLDLGGIAKGYCVDLLTERLNAAGYKNIYVEWGGENRAMGKHPDNRPWTIFISHKGDLDPDHAVAIVELTIKPSQQAAITCSFGK